jgi:hypothetical protein
VPLYGARQVAPDKLLAASGKSLVCRLLSSHGWQPRRRGGTRPGQARHYQQASRASYRRTMQQVAWIIARDARLRFSLTREKWWARFFFSYAPQSHHQSGVLDARIDSFPKPFQAVLAPSRWCLPVKGLKGRSRGACTKLPQVVIRRPQASQSKEIGEFQRTWRRSWRYNRCRGRPTTYGHEHKAKLTFIETIVVSNGFELSRTDRLDSFEVRIKAHPNLSWRCERFDKDCYGKP